MAGAAVVRRWGAVVAALAVVTVAEMGVRTIEGRLPEPRVWPSVEADLKVRQMEALDHADVVLVGSSVVAGGLDPGILSRRLDRSVYNAGLSAGFARLTQRWTESVVLPVLEPDVVVLGTISFDLHDHPSQAAFEAAFESSPGGEESLGAEGPVDRLDRLVAERSALWRHRRSLRRPSVLADAVAGELEAPRPEFGPIGRRGRADYAAVERPDEAGGGLPIRSWDIDQTPQRRMRSLIRTARSAGAEVVVVVMPVSQVYVDRHPAAEADQQRYRQTITRLAAEEGVSLIDLDVMREPDRYLDQVHLDGPAAAELTQQLAEELAAVLGDP